MKEKLIEYLLNCLSHSGLKVDINTCISLLLPIANKIDFDEGLNISMILYHNYYHKNKTWKSYDW